MSILSQIAISQAQALASATIGRFDYFVDSLDKNFKAYDDNNTLILIGGSSFASGIAYNLTVPSNWDGTPANVQLALDELASRVKGIEGKTDLITVTSAINLDDVKAKADSALQSGDNISELVNDSGYITGIVGENHSDLNLNDGTNPHGTTKTDVGLSNVDNTSDINKPISTDTQNALDLKKDDFSENSAFNKNFGTSTGTVLEGDTRTITPSEITTIGNQSGVNTGDETDASIKTKYENNADTNAFTDAEKTKLASLESSKFVGEFVSLVALQTAFPTAPIGSYAFVDSGVGQPVEKYIWDNTDNQWELQQGQSTAETPATIKTKYESNPDTNAFTDAEQTNLGNQSGTNTGDETNTTIQTKRPLKTIENQSLEGVGNIDLDKSDVDLGNVDNTSDADKPISTATQLALDNKEDSFTKNTAFNKDFGTTSGTVLEGDTTTITPTQANDITNNNAKVGITTAQANDITNNNAKVSADGSVTTHNDVTSAGSGEIITTVERTNLNNQSGINTGDETDASIKTKYENNPNTNAFTDAEKSVVNNQSGVNTGDETTVTIQSKRPLKTVNSQSLEGSGNIVIGETTEPYSELTYTSGDLTLIEVYDSISKTTLLTTKDFTYTSGLLTQIVETDVVTTTTKTTNLTYDVNDVLINIEKL